MSLNERKYYLVAAKYDLIRWIEVRALIKAINKNIAKFVKKELVYYYSEYKILIIDKGSKNKLLISDLTKKFGIKKKITFAYYF